MKNDGAIWRSDQNDRVPGHSDQGSQYLATDFQRILSDDGFIQSMSDRGNSQDNAPMESFFGRMKTEALDIIALCPDLSTVRKLIDGYMDEYNHQRYQYSLAGLTPAEFYIYSTTGIYPLDNYFGVTSRGTDVSEQAGRSTVEQSQGKSGQSKRSGKKETGRTSLINERAGNHCTGSKNIAKREKEMGGRVKK